MSEERLRDIVGKKFYEDHLIMSELYVVFKANTLDERRRIEKLVYDYALENRLLSEDYKAMQPEKYVLNKKLIEELNIKTVCDAFAGLESSYNKLSNIDTICSNDIAENANTNNHLKAFSFLALMIGNNKKFDLVDLDPYGSCYDCWPLAIRLAQKGLIISYGDYCNWRYKRTEIINSRYGECNSVEEFEQNLLRETERVAYNYGPKKLTALHIWKPNAYFMRVYYKIENTIYGISNGAWKIRKENRDANKQKLLR